MSNKVIVVPARVSNLAMALRGHINAVLAYARMGDGDLTEEAIRSMRRDMTSFEREIRIGMEGK